MSQNPQDDFIVEDMNALRAAIEAFKGWGDYISTNQRHYFMAKAIRAHLDARPAASQEAAAPSEEPVACNPDWTPEFDEMVAADPILSRAASIICGAACGSYSHCLSREAAVALRDAGLLASPAVAPVAVSVKGLEWDAIGEFGNTFHANAMGFTYVLHQVDESGDWVFFIERQKGQSRYPSLESAKAAAQADFNARILSSIIPSTKGGEAEALPIHGVVISTAADGSESRVSVKEWMRCDDDPVRITFGIFIGNHRWVEAEVEPKHAETIARVILSKPAVAALAQDTDGVAKP